MKWWRGFQEWRLFSFFFRGSYVLRLNLNQQQWQPAPLDAFQAEITSFFSSVLFNRPLFDNSALCFFSFSPSLSLCLLVFLYLMKGPHSYFFFKVFELLVQNSFHALGLCERWDHQHWGGPLIFLLVILWVQALNQPPHPPLKFCLHLVSLCLWCLLLCIQMRKVWFEAPLVLMWRPECQKWRLCVEVLRPWEETGAPLA